MSDFQACEPREWHGRYKRIPGGGTAFHLVTVDNRLWPVIRWAVDGEVATCEARDCDTAAQLAGAVEAAKRKAGGNGSGSFLINEYGQVLVPASDGLGRRFLAGELRGDLLFENPFNENNPINLGDDRGLQCGDPWKLPYVGFQFNLSKRGKICFYRDDEDGRGSVYPDHQDHSLIRAIRSIRPVGAVRFIVNHCGIALTKRDTHGLWVPYYVGKIDFNIWFEKENDHA